MEKEFMFWVSAGVTVFGGLAFIWGLSVNSDNFIQFLCVLLVVCVYIACLVRAYRGLQEYFTKEEK